MSATKEAEQAASWQRFYDRLRALILTFGTEDIRESGDCWILDENWGPEQQKIYVGNLKLLEPVVVNAMQQLVRDFPDWEIRVAIAVPGTDWPDMGLTIRAHEIIDGLQRQYFPSEYRNLHYEGSRPGTERD
jgi:hypothetical protein